jgi:hypothetical protein
MTRFVPRHDQNRLIDFHNIQAVFYLQLHAAIPYGSMSPGRWVPHTYRSVGSFAQCVCVITFRSLEVQYFLRDLLAFGLLG